MMETARIRRYFFWKVQLSCRPEPQNKRCFFLSGSVRPVLRVRWMGAATLFSAKALLQSLAVSHQTASEYSLKKTKPAR
jgi:hypothetical protein